MDQTLLDRLERTLRQQMPISVAMGMAVARWDRPVRDGGRLAMWMPLAPNRNHQETAFAGSLNALCTVVGWGTMFLLLEERRWKGNIVIHRSSIRYRQPVHIKKIVACGRPLSPDAVDYFFELLENKGTSKLEIGVEVTAGGDAGGDLADSTTPLVSFKGAYVVN